MLKVYDLNIYFKEKHILKNINCQIKKNEKIAIIGPSGAGKSSFLRCLNLLEKPTSGKIYFKNIEITNTKTDIRKIRQKMNMVFQDFNLFENKTVLQNITLAPIKLKKIKKEVAVENALNLLKTVGLKNKADSLPRQLSGGQKQRIAILRSIAMQPEIILLDEPTSALDPEMIDEILSLIKEICKSELTMICVTHDINFAKKIAEKFFFMANGTFLETGNCYEIFNNPKNERVKKFLQKYSKI